MYRRTSYKMCSGDVPIPGSGHPLELLSNDFDHNMRNIKVFRHNSDRKYSLGYRFQIFGVVIFYTIKLQSTGSKGYI